MNQTWLIFDCHFLAHRALHSMGDLSYEGVKTGVAFGFFSQVLDLRDMFDTNLLVFAFDSRKSKRKELFPAYKQRRHTQEHTEEEIRALAEFKRQVKILRQVLTDIGHNVLFASGFESDDLIASVVKNYFAKEPASGDQAVIVASDHDLLQLVSHNVMLYNPIKRSRTTLQAFCQNTGLRHPSQWTTVLEIAGCRTDEVPGVGGVGEKTAIAFLKGELKKDSKKHHSITSRQGEWTRLRNRELVRLPFAGTPTFPLYYPVVDQDAWQRWCSEFGFKSLAKRHFFSFRCGSVPVRGVGLHEQVRKGFGLST